MDKFPLFIFNVCLNSLLVFWTTVFLIEAVIFFFRIPRGRGVILLRVLPILKLPFDLFCYNFARWSYTNGIDPLSCPPGSRTLSVGLDLWGATIQFLSPGNFTFTIADILSSFLESHLLTMIMCVVIGGSVVFATRKLVSYFRFMYALRRSSQKSDPRALLINNPKIRNLITKHRISIVELSDFKGSPFVAGLLSKTVYMPISVTNQFTEKEYEAVVAHEIAHIKQYDVLLKFVLGVISAVFWWIPTSWLQKNIEDNQEIACDASTEKYGVSLVDLGSAICKSVKASQRSTLSPSVQYFTRQRFQKRMSILLNASYKPISRSQMIVVGGVFMISLLTIFLGRFWIF